MRGERNTNKNTRKFISISDMEKWEQIDGLMSMPKYEKSFNKVINEALDYGLPLLLKEAKGEVTYESEEENYDEKQVEMYYQLDELIMEIVGLVEEVVLSETMCKSMVCSLFNEKVQELGEKTANGRMLKEGDFRDIPEYLESYERRELRELNERKLAKVRAKQ